MTDRKEYKVRIHAGVGTLKWVYEQTVRVVNAETAAATVAARSGIACGQILRVTVQEAPDD